MRGISEIQKEIEKLRSGWDSYSDLERLDLLERTLSRYEEPQPMQSRYSRSPAPENADFQTLAASVPVDGLISVMAKHMAIIEQIYPVEYQSIMRQLREL